MRKHTHKISPADTRHQVHTQNQYTLARAHKLTSEFKLPSVFDVCKHCQCFTVGHRLQFSPQIINQNAETIRKFSVKQEEEDTHTYTRIDT